MSTKLVIVESPAKARTISGFLGPDFVVESSIGHIRDLPTSASDLPEEYRRYGVDVDNGFKPYYVVSESRRRQITQLKRALRDADEVLLATDEDREGEAIAWHLVEVLQPKVPVSRMVFHEITRSAIEAAIDNRRDIDRRLVDAQETRRILDRLYGYEVSPVVWKRVRPKLSAGRVQSPAVRLVVERERERIAFTAASYWDVEGRFAVDAGGFGATLVALEGTRVATGKDFDRSGVVTKADVVVLDREGAEAAVTVFAAADFVIRSVESKPFRRSPYPPFRTSTLQQEAGRKLRFGSQRTMRAAQSLYENGLITYMRTDSTELSSAAVAAARRQVEEMYGAEYLPEQPRRYQSKVKNAQEAHEAIRPAGDSFQLPDAVARSVGPDEAKVYELIWKRTIASQMADAVGESVQVRLGGTGAAGRDGEFATSGRTITFPGFLRAYVEGSDDPDAQLEDQERPLPPLAEDQVASVESLEAVGHETKPPARYTEASLVKRLEELGIGRPSTYASIMETIQERGYVVKKGTALVPTSTAFAVVQLLEQHFADLIDYGFTASMEEDLDKIARGEGEMVSYLHTFFHGNGHPGLVAIAEAALENADAREVNTLPLRGSEGVVLRNGRYGPYLQVGDDRVSIPDDIPLDELTPERVKELLEAPSEDRVLGEHPESGETVHVKVGRYGPYVQVGEREEGSRAKPPTASLFEDMDPATVTLDDAIQLLSLPRTVGEDPESGASITAQNGRYGPYLKKGEDTRSLESERDLFTVDLEGALALFAEPKQRRGQTATAPLRDLGADPTTGCRMVVKDGRFGLYVTDGSVNASLPRGESPETLTVERASDLLAARRAKMKEQGKTVKPCKPVSSPQSPVSSQTTDPPAESG